MTLADILKPSYKIKKTNFLIEDVPLEALPNSAINQHHCHYHSQCHCNHYLCHCHFLECEIVFICKIEKNPAYWGHWLGQRLQIIIELWKTNKKVWLGTPHVFRALCGADPEQNAGRLASPIWNNSLFWRLHAGTIHKSNPEDLSVFQAPRWDDIWIQPRTTPCFYGSMQGRFKI